jgi:predicted MPP superfamily phosphohydrolase
VERGLEVSQVDVPLGRGDSALHGLRIAFLSDLHAGMYMDAGDLCTLFSRVAAERPDLVCFGGDLIDSRPEEMLHYREALRLLEPPLGVYAVPGNHEYLAEPDLKLFHGVLSEAGVRVLLNEGERVHYEGGSLWLAGVDDHWQGQPDLGMAMHGSDPDEPVVLLSHHPDLFYESASIGVDLTLSGHTHGGQIVIGGRTPCRHTKLGYWRGHFADAGAQLYVSRGAGVTVLPIRLGAPAEVPVLRLRRE